MSDNVSRAAMKGAIGRESRAPGTDRKTPRHAFIAEPGGRHDDRALGPAGGLLLGLALGLLLWATIGFGASRFFH